MVGRIPGAIGTNESSGTTVNRPTPLIGASGILPGGSIPRLPDWVIPTLTERRFTFSTGSMSWIDPRLPLPEADFGGNPGPRTTDRATLLGKEKYRFANFVEAFISVNSAGTVVGHGFTADSGLQMNPSSFLGTSPIPLPTRQSAQVGQEPVRFVQIVGARTNASEIIMQALFREIGRSFAHVNFGLPPIWTELELSIYSDGHVVDGIRRHSLFPSVEWYAQMAGTEFFPWLSIYDNLYDFDARKNLARWIDDGWGMLGTSSALPLSRNDPIAQGIPCSGNPWGITAVRPPDGNILVP